MPDTDKIDHLFEAEGFNPLDDVARAAFRRGYQKATQRAIGIVAAYMNSGNNVEAQITCGRILSDLIV